MPHPYAQDDDALINPINHDDWPTPESELLATLAATPSGEIYARLPLPEWDGLIALGYASLGQDFGEAEA